MISLTAKREKYPILFGVFSYMFISVFIVFNILVLQVDANSQQKSSKAGWGKFRSSQQNELSELMALPYLQGSRLASEQEGVTIYSEPKVYKGINLYTSGHAPEAFLMDMQGEVFHSWQYGFRQIWPNYEVEEENKDHDLFWRRIYLYENGDLLAIFEGIGLIKLDKKSKLLWAHQGGEHHDIEVTDDGLIYALSCQRKLVPSSNETTPILDDFITILNSQGKEVKRVSILECVKKSSFNFLLEKITRKVDIFHTNTLEVFDGKFAHVSDIFKKGNALISLYHIGTVAIVDLDFEKVVWILPIEWKDKHDPTLLKNGNILLFVNNFSHEVSSAIEIDPLSKDIVWEYRGTKDTLFYTKSCGLNQRLPNGNTLLTETENGRAIEVTPEGGIVWEFNNPQRAGEDNELIA